jgi:hypothetical protein
LSIQLGLGAEELVYEPIKRQNIMTQSQLYTLQVNLPNYSVFDVIIEGLDNFKTVFFALTL